MACYGVLNSKIHWVSRRIAGHIHAGHCFIALSSLQCPRAMEGLTIQAYCVRRHPTCHIAYVTSQSPPLEIAVKGGGAHSSTCASSNGVLSLTSASSTSSHLPRTSSPSPSKRALWEDVYARAHVDVVGSPLWFVGVGGFTLLSAQYELAVDNLLSAIVVLTDGQILNASRDEESHLFWAILGSGGQFEIASRVHIQGLEKDTNPTEKGVP
ncbi:hypothetical protein BT96DRAFT_947416 [Gymnopus androsaceus JB14]|uniref:FAD linked oxidase N-terminal domain-containing protein n=1 Tax=Gymnopus androsaceus JB14 TaxID=1447944 RepID=A0A6A4GSP6_9AGAR|nr:hypothetical protein BT96DRAFT_947416 [Gymnopus androsaceus JB14]